MSRVSPLPAGRRTGPRWSGWVDERVRRVVSVLAIFAIAFVLDTATGNRWTAIWGSTAILSSLAVVFPAALSWMLAGAAYVAVWTGFNVARAFMDDVPWATARLHLIGDVERALAGGHLPTERLQNDLVSLAGPAWYDGLSTLIYLSYFVVPHAVAIWLLVTDRTLFARSLLAMGIVFGVSAIAFGLLPTSPPWRDEETIRLVPRVIEATPLARWLGTTNGSGYVFEPNPDASWPSVHLAVTVVLAMVATAGGVRWASLGAAYALLMGMSLVYLGEHYAVDVAAGAVVAVMAWAVSGQWLRMLRPAVASPAVPRTAIPRLDTARPRRSGSGGDAPRTA